LRAGTDPRVDRVVFRNTRGKCIRDPLPRNLRPDLPPLTRPSILTAKVVAETLGQKILYYAAPVRILFAWVGNHDFLAAKEDNANNLGPIGQVLAERQFDELHLFCNYKPAEGEAYIAWLKASKDLLPLPAIELHPAKLSSPTAHREIYDFALATCRTVIGTRDCNVTFHLSPGTPSMHAMWVIIAKTQIKASLLESSPQAGVKSVTIPFDISAELIPDIRDAQLIDAIAHPSRSRAKFDQIIHRSAEMARVIDDAAFIAPRNVPVLIEGESGTGKELFAKAIHAASERTGKFRALNCGAIPHELVEAELFGAVRGAFTGASTTRKGAFESANGGTLFLDELGELPLQAQVKLLRALQEGEVVPVGSTEPIKIDVRIIAATNRSMTDEVAAGRFREDLFYRLAVAVLKLPPLRERKGDLTLLMDRLFATQTAKHRLLDKKLSAGARNLVLTHPWPGNVRELENTIIRAILWSRAPTISMDDMRRAIIKPPRGAHGGAGDILHRPLGDTLKLPDLIEEVAQHYLMRAMEEAGGVKSRATKLVGAPSYQTFDNWLTKYHVRTKAK